MKEWTSLYLVIKPEQVTQSCETDVFAMESLHFNTTFQNLIQTSLSRPFFSLPMQNMVTPGGLARLLIRSCQALSAADLALKSGDEGVEGGSAGIAGESGGGSGGSGAGSGAAFLSGGAEGDMTAAVRMLHELGPSNAGRCVHVLGARDVCRGSGHLGCRDDALKCRALV